MKKRILSLFLALAMCLSLLPTAAFAAEDMMEREMEQVEQVEPVEKEQEPQPTEGGGTADETDEADEAVQAAQALIDALPEKITADNADELEAQLMALDEALAAPSAATWIVRPQPVTTSMVPAWLSWAVRFICTAA